MARSANEASKLVSHETQPSYSEKEDSRRLHELDALAGDTDHPMGTSERPTVNETADKAADDTRGNWGSDAKWRSRIVGYALSGLFVLFSSFGLACSQGLEELIPHWELNLCRFVAQLIICMPLLGVRKCQILIPKALIGWVVAQAMVLVVTSWGLYGCSYYIPLGVVGGVYMTILLNVNIIISALITRSVKVAVVIAAIVSVTGVLLVTQPGGSFPLNKRIPTNASRNVTCARFEDVGPDGMHSPLWDNARNISCEELRERAEQQRWKSIEGYLMCTISAVVSAVGMQIANRRLADLHIVTYGFWSALIGIAVSSILMFSLEELAWPQDTKRLALLASHSLFAAVGVVTSYFACQLVLPEIVAVIMTLQIVVMFIMQYTALSHIHAGKYNIAEIIGALLVFLGNLILPAGSLYKRYSEKRKSAEIKEIRPEIHSEQLE